MVDCFLAKTRKLHVNHKLQSKYLKKITCKNKTLLHLDHRMHGNAPLQVLYFWKQQPQQCKLLAQLTTAPLEYRISTFDVEEFVRLYAQKEL